MREILFRGKRKDNNEWVSGHNIILTEQGKGRAFIVPTGEYIDDCRTKTGELILRMTQIEIVRETVGQYTGLKDKNGKRVFEWDIVKITDRNVCFDTIAVIEFGNPNGLYTWGWQLKPLENKPFAVEILNWVDMEDSGAFIEVIGNIHDNPELLK